MSVLRRVLLLLCVAVLLREGATNSPLDFLRDLKNRIFASNNSTETVEETTDKCLEFQDGVCSVVNGTVEESSERLNQTELTESPQSSGPDEITDDELMWNRTVASETNGTDNIQEWNITETNTTSDYANNFDYPKNKQNETDFNNETLAENTEEADNRTENTRPKRHINKVEINITLKTPGATSAPLTLNTTVFMEKSVNSANGSGINLPSNTIEGKETISNVSLNNGTGVENETITVNLVNSTDENATLLISGNNTDENIINRQKTYESLNTTTDSSGDPAENLQGSIDTISETNLNESTSINCSVCEATEESAGLENTSSNLTFKVNGTGYMGQEEMDNMTRVNSSSLTGQTNLTNLNDILENSTRIIAKIVQNIIPAITQFGNETNATTNLDSELANAGKQNTEATEHQTNVSETLDANNIEIKSKDTNFDGQLNLTNRQLNNKGAEDLNNTIESSGDTSSTNTDIIDSQTRLNLNNSKPSNVTGDEDKREKRSIDFKILSESEEELELSSKFPDTTENTETELLSNTITNATERNSRNETQEVEIVGPVCLKQYEQCTNSSHCCEDYECIGGDENNGTFFCDLRPVNLTQTTNLPLTMDDPEGLQ